MSNTELTAKQQAVLDYIKLEVKDHGYPPSVRDICAATGLKSTSSAHAHLNTLEKKGYIRRDPTKPRAIEILDGEFQNLHNVVNVPVLGSVAAGQPLLAVEQVERYFPLPAGEVPDKELFMLKVKGDSMVNVGILDGDNVIVQHQNNASNGEIVVALVGDSATVKTFYKEKDHIRLQPENDTMDPIIVNADLQILGKVIGVIRLF